MSRIYPSLFICLAVFFLYGTPIHGGWEEIIENQCPTSSVCKITHEDKTYWVKRPESKKFAQSVVWRMRILQWLIPLRMLKPQVFTSPTALMNQEVSRLQTFHQAGISVPRLVYRAQNTLILTDVGMNVEILLRIDTSPDTRIRLLKKVVRAIKILHTKGLYHGRLLLKDVSYKNGRVSFLDLGEAFCGHMDIYEAQARDILLFMYAALPFINNDHKILQEILGYYGEYSDTVIEKLRTTRRYLIPVYWLILPFARFLGNDTRRALVATRTLGIVLATLSHRIPTTTTGSPQLFYPGTYAHKS
ncbi:MAG: hypothetical protein H6849_03340 [Alphaproteobacteria bacterium]|nr:MAG: hypothetical protein H6849_03340 [Alphaproteobacteria bacterium]